MESASAIPVLTHWEQFIKENPQGNIRGFANWLLTHTDPLETVIASEADPVMKSGLRLSEAFAAGKDFLAWLYMGRLIRYVKYYTKAVMSQFQLSGPDEFLFLTLINEMDRPTKKEVSVANATELTTGMDMLRRLQKLGLIDESADERDGRSKRLRLTEKGQETLQAVHQEMIRLEPSFLAELTLNERDQLVQTLQYLNAYHFPHYKP